MYILYQKILENANEIYHIDFNKKICYNFIGGTFLRYNIPAVKFFFRNIFCQLDKEILDIFSGDASWIGRAATIWGLDFREIGRAYRAARLSKKIPYRAMWAEKPAYALVLGRRTGVHYGRT